MKRRFLNILCLLLLLACISLAVFWVRSLKGPEYFHVRIYRDEGESVRQTWWQLISSSGGIQVTYKTSTLLKNPKIAEFTREPDSNPDVRWVWLPHEDHHYPTFVQRGGLWNKLGFELHKYEQRGPASTFISAITFPYWLPLMALACSPSFRLVGLVRKHRRKTLNKCVTCGYDLRATPDRCPECGTTGHS
jgi:hypothetical protein